MKKIMKSKAGKPTFFTISTKKVNSVISISLQEIIRLKNKGIMRKSHLKSKENSSVEKLGEDEQNQNKFDKRLVMRSFEVEILKVGTWTDSRGRTRTFTEEDLERIVKKYNEQTDHEAPLVIGHPKDNSPAYGWVERLEKRGQSIYAIIKPTVQEFVDWVRQGLYKKVSISLYEDDLLRHVGFLGGMPPAVKGLAPIELSEAQEEYEMENFFSEEQSKNNYSEVDMEDTRIKELEKQVMELQKELSDYAERERQKDELIAKLKQEIESLQQEKRRAEHEAFCESLIHEGKIAPAQRSVLIELMEALDKHGEWEFSDTGKNPLLKKFQEFLKSLPKVVEFQEVATKENCQFKIQKDIKDMSGWELLELYQRDSEAFKEAISKNK